MIRKLFCSLLAVLLFATVAGTTVATNVSKNDIIADVVNDLTDVGNGQTCRYDEKNDVLLYELELPIKHDEYMSFSVEKVDEMYNSFQWMADYLKESVVEPYIAGTTSVVSVVSSDRIPIAVFVNTVDVLRGWF